MTVPECSVGDTIPPPAAPPLNQGLVLEGGGLRGNYTAGVLDAFLDAGIEFSYVIGVSAGAAMGCSYVSRQRGRNFQVFNEFHGDPRYLSFRNFFTTGSFFGMKFVFHQIPYTHNIFDWKTFSESPARFVSVCTDCASGEPVYFEKKAAGNSEEFFTAVEASSSMPYTAPIVKFQGKEYLDGAITDAIPLKKAAAEGYKRNVIVLTNPAGFHKKEEPHPPNWLLYHGRKKLIEALKLRVSRYNQSLAFAESEEKAGRALIIRPSEDLHAGRLEKSKEKLIRLYELGLNDARTAVKKVLDYRG